MQSISKKVISKISISLAIVSFVLLYSCNRSTPEAEIVSQDEVNVDVDSEIIKDLNQTKKIFYSLPSPLETALLIKSAGAAYNEKLLNPVSNASNYTTNRSMALNLGIYITDLSFASLFDQTQTTIKYMQAAKKMADGLDILDAIDQNTIKKLEDNINNRDVILDIISETFMSSSSFLKENDREAAAAILLVGGWIEGLYLSSQLVDNKRLEGNKLVQRIVEQKLTFDIVLKMLEENKDNADAASLLAEMIELKKLFDKVDITTSKNEVVNENNVDVIKSTSKINVKPEDFKNLTDKVKSIRNSFTL